MKKPRNPIPALKRVFSRLYDRATGYVRGVGRQTDEILTGEPIDFSAPSIPYYENLAARLSFAKVVLYMVLLVFVEVIEQIAKAIIYFIRSYRCQIVKARHYIYCI